MPPVSDASLRTGGSASSSPNKSSPPEPESRLAHDSTPIFTPSTTPSSEPPQQDEIREKDNSRAPQTDRTGHLETMSPPNSPGGATVVVTPETKEETAAVDENTASKLEPHAAPNVSETTSAKPVCKRHTAKGNKSAKKHVNKWKRKNKNLATDSSNSSSDLSTTSASDSSSSTSSSSESESESESEEDTDSETEGKEKRKGHKKAKKNSKNKKGNKQKRKSKGSHRKHHDLSETSSDENSEDDSVAEKAQRKTSSKLRAKKKAKKVKLDDEISEDIEEEQNQIDPDNLAYIQEQLAALGLKCTGLAQKSRRRANDDKPTKNNGKKAAKSKGKRASKVAYKRVDQREYILSKYDTHHYLAIYSYVQGLVTDRSQYGTIPYTTTNSQRLWMIPIRLNGTNTSSLFAAASIGTTNTSKPLSILRASLSARLSPKS